MRSSYHLPWLKEGDVPSEHDEWCVKNIDRVAQEVALHSRLTKAEVKESIYRLIGHECNHMYTKPHGSTLDSTKEDACTIVKWGSSI